MEPRTCLCTAQAGVACVEQSHCFEMFMEFHVPQTCQVTPSDANFFPGGDGTVLVPGSCGVVEARFLGLVF